MLLKVFSARELTSARTAVRGIRRFIRQGAPHHKGPLDPPRAGNLLRIDRKKWRPAKFLVISSNRPLPAILVVRDGKDPVDLIKPRKVDSWHVFRAE